VWHRKFSGDIAEVSVRHVIEKLAELPLYHLPKAAQGHTRHFMPQKDPLGSDKTKVFDAFVSVKTDEPLIAAWSTVTLSPGERQALALLVSGLTYLGRAESWVKVEVLDEWIGGFNCRPLTQEVPVQGERVRVLAAMTPVMFQAWVRGFTAQVVGEPTTKTKATKKGKTSLGPVPSDLWAALHAETSDLQKQGWSAAPGSRWVDYDRPADAFRVIYKRKPRIEDIRPTVARFALSSAVLPRLTDALFIGERIRQALMAKSRGLNGSEHALPVFSGKALDGSPLNDNHEHAFYLPSDDDGDGRLDHITVYAAQGFDKYAQQALGALRKVWGSGGHDIHTVLVGLGQPEDYGGCAVQKGQSPQLAESRIWVSRTPFLLARHPKRNGKDSPTAQVRVELIRQGFPDPVKVTSLDHTVIAGKKLRWLEFQRIRKQGNGRLAGPRGYGFRIEFRESVNGPIALGYACHFGLGQFVAVED
jgi:CRISPR-associated protein Csb2